MANEDDMMKRNNSEQEINRKRKNNNNGNTNDNQISKKINHNNNNNNNHDEQGEEHDNDMLSLSLSLCPAKPILEIPEQESSPLPSPLPSQSPPPPPPLSVSPLTIPQDSLSVSMQTVQGPLQLSPTHAIYMQPFVAESSPVVPAYGHHQEPVSGPGPARPLRLRRNPTQAPGEGKGDTVPVLFPWSTTQRAKVHSFNYLVSKNITTITGEVQCKKCEKQYEMAYDLREKFFEVGRFIAENKSSMHDRAPNVWMNPVLPTCKFCEQENSAKPVNALKKKQMNWLFLLLGQLLGCCTLDQLKYFCKHTKNHRTGAKDRVLYLTYLGLCKQLDPNGPFDR